MLIAPLPPPVKNLYILYMFYAFRLLYLYVYM